MSTNDRPTPETDAFYRHRENLERVARIEVGTIAVKWGECGKHARRLEQQRDALAEALEKVVAEVWAIVGPYGNAPPGSYARGFEVGVETAGKTARAVADAALAALERGNGKEGS